jgi:hypothetical protein
MGAGTSLIARESRRMRRAGRRAPPGSGQTHAEIEQRHQAGGEQRPVRGWLQVEHVGVEGEQGGGRGGGRSKMRCGGEQRASQNERAPRGWRWVPFAIAVVADKGSMTQCGSGSQTVPRS